MAFSKEVLLHVDSLIRNLDDNGLPDGEPETSVFDCPAIFLYDKKGYFALRYTEGKDEERVECEVTVRDDCVCVCRRGAAVCDMILQEGVEHPSVYKVPPYAFDLLVTARRIRNGLSPEGGTLNLFYRMNIGGADKEARLKIDVFCK